MANDFTYDDAALGRDGATHEGYKGGDFKMSLRTPIWVANYGDATGTALIGIQDCGWIVRLATGYRDY